MKISPSLLAADYWNLQSQISLIETSIDRLHFDVMDGHFVPNLSIGIPVIETLRKHTKLIFDVHLMIENPEKYIDKFIKAGSDILTFHIEATSKPLELINEIKSKGIKAGIALKPSTSVSEVQNIIKYVDQITVMSVEPGFGGQKFMPEILPKIKELSSYGKPIEVDGGINKNNIKEIISAGSDIVVVGTAIFNEQNIVEALKNLYSIGGGIS